ncbi:MAG TPA: nitroreductase [Aggregatilinea sp.]|jgi:nitroreductase|uniref:nitroreductase family protein n=1 Tax=Aggregatilinea sp. TaxID=2806333 RepID=UPI002C13652D|nr:nitroreductase [Aggregatilinea sp.]HML23617.1 nitroreductase [Aggregatilinea sp.]
MDVSEAIKSNRSVRQFTDQPVPREQIEQIVNAGRLSGSAKNRQPWSFVVVTQRDTLQTLSQCGPWCTHLAGAAFAVVMVVKDMHEPPTLTTPFDLGRASQNMILAAWELGIGSCMATVYEPDRTRAALSVPADRAVPWAISFGYPHPDIDPRGRAPRKEGRRSFEDVASWEAWDENA